MELYLYRKHKGSIGEFFKDDDFLCYTLENPHRCSIYDKVNGKTRIMEGRYKIEKLKVVTPLTQRYRNRQDLKRLGCNFDFHLEIKNVPNFTNVYIHIGNKQKDTDGCILTGYGMNESAGTILNSVKAYVDIYNLISKSLNDGDEVWVNIFNLDL